MQKEPTTQLGDPVDYPGIINELDWGLDYSDGVFIAVDTAGNVRQSDGGDVWVTQDTNYSVGAFTPKGTRRWYKRSQFVYRYRYNCNCIQHY